MCVMNSMVVYGKVLSVAHQLIHEKGSVKDVYCAYKAIYSLHVLCGACASSMHCEQCDSVVYSCVGCSHN